MRTLIERATGVKPLEAVGAASAQGFSGMQTLLQKNPNISMVLGVDDDVILGADQALVQHIARTHGSPKDVYLAGMDGENQALQLIAKNGGPDGTYRASGALDLTQSGEQWPTCRSRSSRVTPRPVSSSTTTWLPRLRGRTHCSVSTRLCLSPVADSVGIS